jgi:hypothetical protein
MEQAMVRQQDDDFGKDYGLIHEAIVTGRKVGAGRKFWTKLAHDESMFNKVVSFVARDGYEPTTSQKLAREIMGKNFFGVEEAVERFGVNPSKQQLAQLAEIPFTEKTLRDCNGTHVLVAAFPLSVLDVRAVNSGLFYSSSGGWYESEKFAKNKGKVGWYLVQKTPVKDSVSKNWDEQQALLSENDETPTSQVMVYTIIGHYKATGERLFENIYVRCSDVVSGGYRVDVGHFASDGLHVDRHWGAYRHSFLRVSASRKS